MKAKIATRTGETVRSVGKIIVLILNYGLTTGFISLSWMVDIMGWRKMSFAHCTELMYPGMSSKKAAGDTGLGDERSMTEVSVKEQMKKLVG
ncbi:hypothetical protein Tco_0629280 [Tanacetum coccineum]|uniref:Uncharacterized protein n=1 Tax=Tanacetum coccineum TaxID=301880 RepID=A0ABQ4WSR1_9ASTR